VEINPPPQPPARSRSVAARVVWGVLVVVTLFVCYFSHLGAIGFVGPDEPRYAWIAREMAESGDWVTPRLYSKPWFEKPPLFYWGAALSFKIFGVSEAAARLPSAISALLATLVLAWLAWRTYGADTGRWLLLLLPTTVGMIGFSHAASTDMSFSGTLTVAMVAAAVLLGLVPSPLVARSPSTSSVFASTISLTSSTSFTSLLLGFFLGLAVLAKGPAALILCGGAVFFWALFTQRWRDALRLLHPAGIAAFCVTALPWFILCAHRNPDFLRIFIVEHNFKRYLTPEFQHIQPSWYYGEIILLAFLPWAAALLWATVVGIRRTLDRALGGGTIFLLCWSVFCVAFFTISRSKLPGYILPAIPAIALLLTRAGVSAALDKRRSLALVSVATALVFGGLFWAVLADGGRVLKNLAPFAPLIGLVLMFFAVANLFFALLCIFPRSNFALVVVVGLLLVTFELVDMVSQFTPSSILSPRYLATQIQVDRLPLDALRVFQLRRATHYGLNFYLRSDLQEWNGDTAREVYILAGIHQGCSIAPKEMTCVDLWGRSGQPGGLALLHLTPKLRP
jgi:4-amino-4-deoxy-L-arabinose transferase-like glycosyltransferase